MARSLEHQLRTHRVACNAGGVDRAQCFLEGFWRLSFALAPAYGQRFYVAGSGWTQERRDLRVIKHNCEQSLGNASSRAPPLAQLSRDELVQTTLKWR